MGLASIDFLAVDEYKRYDIASLPLSHCGRLQDERARSIFPVNIVLTKFEQTSAVHQPHEGRKREGEGERDLIVEYKRVAVLDTPRLERVLDNKSNKSYKTETEAATPSAR